MGRLTVENKMCLENPELISMAVRHLIKENGCVLLGGVTGRDYTDIYMEGPGLPEGEKQFGIRMKDIVPGVAELSIVIF